MEYDRCECCHITLNTGTIRQFCMILFFSAVTARSGALNLVTVVLSLLVDLSRE